LPLFFGNYPQRHNLDIEVIYASNDDQTLAAARKGHIDLVGGPEVERPKLMVAEQLCQSIDTGFLPNFRKLDPFFAANSFIRSEGVLYGIPKTHAFPPLLDDGLHMTYSQMQEEWERFKRSWARVSGLHAMALEYGFIDIDAETRPVVRHRKPVLNSIERLAGEFFPQGVGILIAFEIIAVRQGIEQLQGGGGRNRR
jgi:hypothetical protein